MFRSMERRGTADCGNVDRRCLHGVHVAGTSSKLNRPDWTHANVSDSLPSSSYPRSVTRGSTELLPTESHA